MKYLRRYIRQMLIEQNVLATGMCFPFAYQKAEEWFEAHFIKGSKGRRPKRHPDLNDKSKFKVVHGTVTDKWKQPAKPVVHGWVEMGDLVFDDQTKVTKPDGVHRKFYYEMYQPEVYQEFTAEEAVVNCIKYGGEGPWDDDLYAQMQTRDAWMNEATKHDNKFSQLMAAGLDGIEQAFQLADSLGIPTQELPWTLQTVSKYIDERGEEEYGYGWAEHYPELLEPTGWSIEKWRDELRKREEETDRMWAEKYGDMNEATQYDDKFKTLMDAGYDGIKEALFLADSLGIPSQELPWDLRSIDEFLYKDPRGHEELLPITGWEFGEWLAASQKEYEDYERSIDLSESAEYDDDPTSEEGKLAMLVLHDDEIYRNMGLDLFRTSQHLDLDLLATELDNRLMAGWKALPPEPTAPLSRGLGRVPTPEEIAQMRKYSEAWHAWTDKLGSAVRFVTGGDSTQGFRPSAKAYKLGSLRNTLARHLKMTSSSRKKKEAGLRECIRRVLLEITATPSSIPQESLASLINYALDQEGIFDFTEKFAGTHIELVYQSDGHVDARSKAVRQSGGDFSRPPRVAKAIGNAIELLDPPSEPKEFAFEYIATTDRPDYINYLVGDKPIAIEYSGVMTIDEVELLNSAQEEIGFMNKDQVTIASFEFSADDENILLDLSQEVEAGKVKRARLKEIGVEVSRIITSAIPQSFVGGPIEGLMVQTGEDTYKIPNPAYADIQRLQAPIYAVFSGRGGLKKKDVKNRLMNFSGNDRIVSNIDSYLVAVSEMPPGFRSFFSADEIDGLLILLDELKAGDPEAGAEIYNVFNSRVNDRNAWRNT